MRVNYVTGLFESIDMLMYYTVTLRKKIKMLHSKHANSAATRTSLVVCRGIKSIDCYDVFSLFNYFR